MPPEVRVIVLPMNWTKERRGLLVEDKRQQMQIISSLGFGHRPDEALRLNEHHQIAQGGACVTEGSKLTKVGLRALLAWAGCAG